MKLQKIKLELALARACMSARDLRQQGLSPATIVWRFYEGFTLQQAAELDGVTRGRIGVIEDAALRALRQNQELRRFYGEDLLSRAYRRTGFGAWKSGGSVQERLAERQEEKEHRLAASSTKHLADLLGLDAKELYGLFDDIQQ